jgi:hypothetical protein
MHNRQATPRHTPAGGEQQEMKRRIAGCRERLRRNRATHRIVERCAAPADEGRATGEALSSDAPAPEAHGKESGREG